MENYTGEVVYAAKRSGVECFLGDATCLKYKVKCGACPSATVHSTCSTSHILIHLIL